MMAYKVKSVARLRGKKPDVREKTFRTKQQARKFAGTIRELTKSAKLQFPKSDIGRAKVRTTISKM
jgi:hypothetical protein